MTEETKAAIIELYDGAKDKRAQVDAMAKMGFGTKGEILYYLHSQDRAHDIQAKKKKQRNERKPEEDLKEQDEKRNDKLPMPQDVKDLLIDELEGIDLAIKEIQEIIDEKEKEKHRLEMLYKHVVEVISQ